MTERRKLYLERYAKEPPMYQGKAGRKKARFYGHVPYAQRRVK